MLKILDLRRTQRIRDLCFARFGVQGSGWFRVWGSGFRVQGSGFRAQGLGFRVYKV